MATVVDRLSDSNVQRARQADLAAYLRSHGYQLTRDGRQWRLPDYGGMVIDGNHWFCFSTSRGGNSLDFLVEVLGIPFREAVDDLLRLSWSNGGEQPSDGDSRRWRSPDDPSPRQHQFTLPARSTSWANVLRYLNGTRRLRASVVARLVFNGLLYQNMRGDCVFPSFDIQGNPRAALIRGTAPTVRYIRMAFGSDCAWGWHHPPVDGGPSDFVAVTESPIDAVSLAVLRPWLWDHHLFSLNGLHRQALPTFLDEQPGIKKVALALDSDMAGNRAADEMLTAVHQQGKIAFRLAPPAGAKDWNEHLVRQRA